MKRILLSSIVLAFACSTAQAQSITAHSSLLTESMSHEQRVKAYERTYNYHSRTAGLAVFKSRAEVQKCLKWVSWAPPADERRNYYIAHALYDIATAGDIYLSERISLSLDPGTMANRYYKKDTRSQGIKQMFLRAQSALDYCKNQVKPIPADLVRTPSGPKSMTGFSF